VGYANNMSKIFIFKQSNKPNWSNIREQFNSTLNDIIRRINFGEIKKDFEIEIREICKKRSKPQLSAYWLLIGVVTKWMNEQGNKFTAENVSDYFKIQAGHSAVVDMYSVPKSIADKSDCTVEQMEAIIHEIIEFGARNEIKDCYIEPRNLQELLNNFR